MLGNQIHESEHTKIAAAVAGSSTLDNDLTIPPGAKSVEAILHIGSTVTADASSLLQVFVATVSDYSDAVEVAALKTVIVAGMASKHVRLELVRPLHKYYRFRVARGGGGDSISIDGGSLIVHGVRKLIDPIQSLCIARTVAIDAGP